MPKCLLAYLQNQIQSSSLTLLCETDVDFENFLLSSTVEEVTQVTLISQLPPARETNSYFEFIDHTIQFLVSTKSKNVLVDGYKDNAMTNYSFHNAHINPQVSFAVNHIKNCPYWNMLLNLIGRDPFLNLILNTRCFITLRNGSSFQVFGVNLKRKHDDNQKSSIDKSSVLQRSRHSIRVSTIVTKDRSTLLERILQTSCNRKNISKKYRKLDKLLDTITSNDTKANYFQMLNNLIPPKLTDFNSNFNNASSMKDIIKVVLVVFGSLFPLKTWGTSVNKSVVIKHIVNFVKAPPFEQTHVHEILKSIKLTDIAWLGKTDRTTSKQDYKLRLDLFGLFIHWVFKSVVCRILTSFWYVTESPNLVEGEPALLYFPHYHWNRITSRWLSEYIETDLYKVGKDDVCVDTSLDTFNFGTIKLIPKARDLRLICVPSKVPFGAFQNDPSTPRDQFKFEYYNYSFEVIAPIRQILTYKIKCTLEFDEFIPKCYSKADVAIAILNYKKRLGLDSSHKELANVYVLKFDMKHCYDRLDHGELVDCLESLFVRDQRDKTYYVRQYSELSLGDKIKRAHAIVREDTEVIEYNYFDVDEIKTKTPGRFFDRGRTFKFSTAEILSVIKAQVFESVLVVGEGEFYKRRRGVFQGFPLSATLCDLVYNRLSYREFAFLNGTPSLLLRVVDDFLFISTEKLLFQRVKEVIDGDSLQKYGGHINTSKTKLFDPLIPMAANKYEIIEFLGLKINPVTLDFSREVSKDAFPSLRKQLSFKGAYKYLIWSYNVQLQSYLVNLRLQAIQNVIYTISNWLTAIMNAFRNYFLVLKDKSDFDASSCALFFSELLHITLMRFHTVNYSGIKRSNNGPTEESNDEIEIGDTLIVSEFRRLARIYLSDLGTDEFLKEIMKI